jgi:choline dehydrogenase-like flavoprotein
VPLGFTRNFRTEVDWDLATHPEPELQRRRIYLPRGRTLGGSSSLNAMVYIRGNRADYDGWARLGCEGWGFDDLLPFFMRAEDNERGAGDWHGSGGPLRVSDGRSRNPIAAAFVEAAVQAGMARNEDFNGPEQDGAGWYQATQRDGLRCSTAVAYLHPVAGRPNLELSTPHDVDRALDGMRRLLEIAAQPALAPYAKTPHAVPASGGDDDLLRHIRATAQTLYHPVGTCAMGGVVDSELRVLGVEGLRVVDASVMPQVPRGNTNAPVIAIAERAADLIRGAA